MSLYVVEVGSQDLGAVLGAVCEILPGAPSELSVIRADNQSDADRLFFRSADMTPEELQAQMVEGKILVASFKTTAINRGLAIVQQHSSGDSNRRYWSAAVDAGGSPTPSKFQQLLGMKALAYVVVSVDDTIVLDMESVADLDADFPWDHWLLVQGAIRKPDQTWDYRIGACFSTE